MSREDPTSPMHYRLRGDRRRDSAGVIVIAIAIAIAYYNGTSGHAHGRTAVSAGSMP